MGLIIGILWALLALVLTLVTYLLYSEVTTTKYYKQKKVLYLGNNFLRLMYIVARGIRMPDNVQGQYAQVKKAGKKFGVSIEGKKQVFFITDLELIKRITVKDFDHFVDRRSFKGTKGDELISKMLLSVEGEPWKALRSKMSPTFTTGKIKRMFSILDKSSKEMAGYFHRRLEEGDPVLDLQQGFSKYTMDFIAAAAFGIGSKAFEQKEPSLFEQMGAKISFQFDFLTLIKFITILSSTKLSDLLGLSLFDSRALDFFSNVIKSTIKQREETKEKRVDFIQLMLEARAGKLKIEDSELNEFEKEQQLKDGNQVAKINLDDDDIVAQCVLFILGGFDTTQGLLLWAGYNLAIFQDMQQRLFEEVQKAVDDNDGELSYESVNQMEYMEMFISETLRYYPPVMAVERTCTKEYTIPETDAIIRKGAMVVIPIYGIHRDPDNYPDPLKFDPERFSPGNKSKILPYSYLPFGLGPRSCIAMRLAIVEVKVAIAQLVLNFTLHPTEKTPVPTKMKYANQSTLRPEDGLWLKLEKRK